PAIRRSVYLADSTPMVCRWGFSSSLGQARMRCCCGWRLTWNGHGPGRTSGLRCRPPAPIARGNARAAAPREVDRRGIDYDEPEDAGLRGVARRRRPELTRWFASRPRMLASESLLDGKAIAGPHFACCC